ncbi:hypothetical protein NM688_g5827 [Phlebia brevispora]|uniref:Uncharacterized protein n=1 Tax=Phlebia brevispora TaxID=194682 RepID=A0ACC1SPB0_9APHY|nr:hypothetical protein NM688_g5827 [Phlebia brevispora]
MVLFSSPLWLCVLVLARVVAFAGSVSEGGSCSTNDNHLDPATHKFITDCNDKTFCSGTNGTCQAKQCRRDEFPFGYDPGDVLPPMCGRGTFCPDEGSGCQSLIAVGQPCQLNRDDQCAPPNDWQPLASSQNVNGSICLQSTCMYANATLGQRCIIDSVTYIDVGPNGQQISNNICFLTKPVGSSCALDQECRSVNCGASGTCQDPLDMARKLQAWQVAVTSAAVALSMVSTVTSLVVFHKRLRLRNHRELCEYYHEQLKATDLFKFNNINLDIWTETYGNNFYLSYLARWPDLCYVQAAPSGRLMSYGLGKAEGLGTEWHGHVTAITVAPEYRRLNLARKMMNMLEHVSDQGYKGYFVDLYVRCTNTVAIGMYERLGVQRLQAGAGSITGVWARGETEKTKRMRTVSVRSVARGDVSCAGRRPGSDSLSSMPTDMRKPLSLDPHRRSVRANGREFVHSVRLESFVFSNQIGGVACLYRFIKRAFDEAKLYVLRTYASSFFCCLLACFSCNALDTQLRCVFRFGHLYDTDYPGQRREDDPEDDEKPPSPQRGHPWPMRFST